MAYTNKSIPLKDSVCGNCRQWDRCKEIIASFKPTNAKREENDPSCIQFYPLVIDGQEISFEAGKGA